MWSVLYTSIISFGTAYFIIEIIGLTGAPQSSVREVFYSVPFLICSVLLLIAALVSSIGSIRKHRVTGWLALISTTCIVSGLWVSFLTGFRGEVILTEGQTYYSGHDSYMPETLYIGKFASVPDVGLKLDELVPTVSKDQMNLKGLRGKFSLITTGSGKQPEEVVITNGLPTFLESTFFRIKDMGYSPRYELKSKEGKFLDSSFMFMKLFPPGSEDNFRLLSPLTYYVRYYPNGKEDIEEPLIALRIVRNKDIVFNGNIKVSEDAVFENSRISFEAVRIWTILSISHDPGVLLYIPGLILAFLYTIVKVISRKKSSHEQT